jgi:hypothetical protein
MSYSTPTPRTVSYKIGCGGCLVWPLTTIAVLWLTGHLV